jgi:hypothetical protein
MPEPSLHCRSCGTDVPGGRRFCPACGELYPAEPADRVPTLAGALLDMTDELRPLLAEKAALGNRLEALAVVHDQRPLTPDERRDWEQAYARWRDVGFEVTLAVDRVHPRSERDRRSAAAGARPSEAAPIRSPDDRRDPYWNRAP